MKVLRFWVEIFVLVIDIFPEVILAIPLPPSGADSPGGGGHRPFWALSVISLPNAAWPLAAPGDRAPGWGEARVLGAPARLPIELTFSPRRPAGPVTSGAEPPR